MRAVSRTGTIKVVGTLDRRPQKLPRTLAEYPGAKPHQL